MHHSDKEILEQEDENLQKLAESASAFREKAKTPELEFLEKFAEIVAENSRIVSEAVDKIAKSVDNIETTSRREVEISYPPLEKKSIISDIVEAFKKGVIKFPGVQKISGAVDVAFPLIQKIAGKVEVDFPKVQKVSGSVEVKFPDVQKVSMDFPVAQKLPIVQGEKTDAVVVVLSDGKKLLSPFTQQVQSNGQLLKAIQQLAGSSGSQPILYSSQVRVTASGTAVQLGTADIKSVVVQALKDNRYTVYVTSEQGMDYELQPGQPVSVVIDSLSKVKINGSYENDGVCFIAS